MYDEKERFEKGGERGKYKGLYNKMTRFLVEFSTGCTLMYIKSKIASSVLL
jgi:hypothetical protein